MRLAIALALLLSLAAPAQQVHLLGRSDGAPGVGALQATVTQVVGSARPGGIGFVRIDLENLSSRRARDVEFALMSGWSESFVVRERARLEPGGSARMFLPLYGVGMNSRLVSWVDGLRENPGGWIENVGNGTGHASGLFLSDVPRAELGWRDAILVRAGLASEAFELTNLRPSDLPPTWQMVSGFDVIVVDGRARGLDRTAQSIVVEYLRAGGDVLVVEGARLADGPLAEVAALDDVEFVRHRVGFGRLLAIAGAANLPGGPAPPSVGAELDDWLSAPKGGLVARCGLGYSGPLPGEFRQVEEIPGFGRVPLRTFFLLLLGFAIVVGPVNYFYWWRRRRLSMLVFTVPALGFGATIVMLVYGLASEGFGIRQVERSITVLDQVRHEASCWAARTVFAGLAPDRLRPASGTFLFAPGMISASNGGAGTSFEQWSDGSIDGALVPSRTLCALPTATVAPERARLRFRRSGEAALEVLPSDDLRPITGEQRLVLRDPAGVCYLAAADGILRRVDERDASSVVARLVNEATRLVPRQVIDYDDRRYLVVHGGIDPPAPAESIATRVGRLAQLHPGTYVALVERSPVFDELGLSPDERSGIHLVIGQLAAEDIVD